MKLKNLDLLVDKLNEFVKINSSLKIDYFTVKVFGDKSYHIEFNTWQGVFLIAPDIEDENWLIQHYKLTDDHRQILKNWISENKEIF